MSDAPAIFENHALFDPAADFDAFLKTIPAKWAVYLLADREGQPVQLLCVKNLRASLKRRLGGQELIGPSRKVNYREVVGQVHWRRVDSAFESDWIYYEAARQVFPESYRGMVGFRPAWFVHIDPQAPFPRYSVKAPSAKGPGSGVFFGPIETKDAAGRLIELVEDAFDLCRYYNILVQSPHGKACAYKQMHKCAAPCDGSVSMDQFRRLYEMSVQALEDPKEIILDQTRRMQQAAGELRFELAGKIKAFIAQLEQFNKGPYRQLRRLDDFRFVSLQRGPREGTARLFLITPGSIHDIAALIGEPKASSPLLRQILDQAEARATDWPDETGAERLGVVAHHLFSPKQSPAAFIPLALVDEKSLAKRYRELLKQPPPEESEEEGIVRELQAM